LLLNGGLESDNKWFMDVFAGAGAFVLALCFRGF